jgi:hypothetical protein
MDSWLPSQFWGIEEAPHKTPVLVLPDLSKPCKPPFTMSRGQAHTSMTSTRLAWWDSKDGEPPLWEKCMASLPSMVQPQWTSITMQLCTGDANQIWNSNPSISFFSETLLYRFWEYALLPKAPRYKQPSLVASWHSGATQIRLASQKSCTNFFSFSKERRDNWRQLALDRYWRFISQIE